MSKLAPSLFCTSYRFCSMYAKLLPALHVTANDEGRGLPQQVLQVQTTTTIVMC